MSYFRSLDLAPMVRALSHRNFRLFFFGQAVSLIGTFLQQVAMQWLVFTLTGQPLWLGIVSFIEQIPTLFLAPLAGVFTDRWNRHRVLIITQSLFLVQAFALSGLVLSGRVEVWHLLILSGFLGLVQAFDITTRQGFFSEMVPSRADLANAIALNSSIVNGSRLLGPALAGLVIQVTSVGICFFFNGLSYLAVLVSLLRMEVPRAEVRVPAGRFWQGFREGLVYTYRTRPIRRILFVMAAVSFLGIPYSTLLPVIVRDDLDGGAGVYGGLMAASGAGALGAAVTLAGRRSIIGLGRRIAGAPLVFGFALIVFSQFRVLWLAWILLPVMGYAVMLQMASCNTILQTIAPEDKRGRILGFSIMSFIGTVPLGNLTFGALARHIGVPSTLLLGGLGCMAASLWFSLGYGQFRRDLREFYIRLDILPSPADANAAAATVALTPSHPDIVTSPDDVAVKNVARAAENDGSA